MKKISVFAIIMAMGLGAANAAHNNTANPNYNDPINGDVPAPAVEEVVAVGVFDVTPSAPVVATPVITAKQAKALADETPVVLRGNIIKKLSGEKYTFQDGTDTITVEIDDDYWVPLGLVIPTETITVYGEVDSGFFKTEVDVDRIVVE